MSLFANYTSKGGFNRNRRNPSGSATGEGEGEDGEVNRVKE